jgi:hypothetical protein
MRQKSNSTPASETLVRNIRRATRKHHAAEEKIRIVLDGLRGETSIAEFCRREGIAENVSANIETWFTVRGPSGRRGVHSGVRSARIPGGGWENMLGGRLVRMLAGRIGLRKNGRSFERGRCCPPFP